MSEIDAAAFAEWVLSKAVRAHEAHDDDINKSVVADAVKRAIARSEDEVHITCTLAGASGPVEVDEQMSRTAAENLFAVVHPNRPQPKREPEPETNEPEREKPEPSRIMGIDGGTFVVLALLLISVGIVVSIVVSSEHSKEHDHHEKSESRH